MLRHDQGSRTLVIRRFIDTLVIEFELIVNFVVNVNPVCGSGHVSVEVLTGIV